jgi:predicted S18 family serine protease
MKRILAAVLLLMTFASPAFAAKHPRQHHQHSNYRYHAPKYKAHPVQKHHSHRHAK